MKKKKVMNKTNKNKDHEQKRKKIFIVSVEATLPLIQGKFVLKPQ